MVPFHGGGVLVNLEHMYTCIYVYLYVNIDIDINKNLETPAKTIPAPKGI